MKLTLAMTDLNSQVIHHLGLGYDIHCTALDKQYSYRASDNNARPQHPSAIDTAANCPKKKKNSVERCIYIVYIIFASIRRHDYHLKCTYAII